MDNMDEVSNINDLDVDNSLDIKNEDQISFFKVKDHQSINESNLMTLPFIWLKRKKINVFSREWKKSNGELVSLKVVGGEDGVPQIAELDVLLALFRIHLKNNKNGFYRNKKTKKSEIPQRIHFTYLGLANELGYKQMGGALKKKLEKSIKKLNETTIYNSFAIMDAEKKEYVATFKGEKSCRILKNYTSYEKKIHLREEGKLLNPQDILDYQYIEIDDFFFNNMCNDYFKVYDYEKYKLLKKNVSKKLFLILSTWSKSASKYLSYQVIFDYVGLDVMDTKEKYFQVSQVKKAMDEYVSIGYIDGYNERKGEGIEIIYNKRKLDTSLFKTLYLTESECVSQLRAYDIQYEEMNDIINKNGLEYVASLLRSMKYRIEQGDTISNKRRYVIKAIEKGDYNLNEFKLDYNG
ncbi:MAG: hypothetical protein RSC24_06815 [Clostridium sp.]